jgi:hypothetical protein
MSEDTQRCSIGEANKKRQRIAQRITTFVYALPPLASLYQICQYPNSPTITNWYENGKMRGRDELSVFLKTESTT